MPVCFSEIERGQYIDVFERCNRSRLAFKSGKKRSMFSIQIGTHYFECYLTVHRGLVRHINCRHASLPKFAANLVTAKLLPDQWIGGITVVVHEFSLCWSTQRLPRNMALH